MVDVLDEKLKDFFDDAQGKKFLNEIATTIAMSMYADGFLIEKDLDDENVIYTKILEYSQNANFNWGCPI